MAEQSVVHVVVPLEVVDGWPPIAAETLLAHAHAHADADADGAYVLDQTPAFALDLSLGDTVAATLLSADSVEFERRIASAGHRTFRLIALDDAAVVDPVLDRLTALGARVAPSGFPALWCVDVPPQAAEPAVRSALEEAASRGVLEFEDPRTP